MTDEARRKGSAGSSEETVDFIVADCTKSTSYAGEPFDLVFGAWLLDYAPDLAGLGHMFHNIALDLKHDGHFVSVTLVPAQNPMAAVDAEFQAWSPPEGSGAWFMTSLRMCGMGCILMRMVITRLGLWILIAVI